MWCPIMLWPDQLECLSLSSFSSLLKVRGSIHDFSFPSYLNGSNKLEYYNSQGLKSLARDKHANLLRTFISYEENEVL
jgi:hypothetical protein